MLHGSLSLNDDSYAILFKFMISRYEAMDTVHNVDVLLNDDKFKSSSKSSPNFKRKSSYTLMW